MYEEIHRAVADRNENSLINIIKNEDIINEIKENPWEIVPLFVGSLNTTIEKDYPNFYKGIIAILHTITERIDPDDVILILVKEIENVKEDATFLLLLKLIEPALLKILPKNKLNYLAWSLNAAQTYLTELPIPENFILEDKEKLLLDADLVVARITMLYYDMLPFYDSILNAILILNYEDHKILLLKSILQLFGHPFLYLDMDANDKPKSRARLQGENLITKVIQLCPDTFAFLKEGFCDDHEDIKVKQISLSVFYYLHIGEKVGLERSFKVYDPIFIFQNSLCFVVALLTVDHQFVIEKGLRLMSSLLQITSNFVLPYQLLDSDIHCKFCKSISNVIIYNSVESCRKETLKVFHDYVYKFDCRGRYLLVYNLMKTVDNISMKSYIVTQYKQMLVEQFDKNNEINYYFKGSKLAALLAVFCHLVDGIETDLVKSADQIIASLNLIRYLIIRDKSNITGIWDDLPALKRSFLEPLKEALILSKAHYNLKLKEIQDENAHGDNLVDAGKISVSIQGKYLPELSPEEKTGVINASITAFDVIDSLLSRLNECIEYGFCNVIKKKI